MIDPVNPSPKESPKDPKRKPPTPGGGDLPPVWRGLLWYIPVLLFLLWFWQYLFSSMSVETIPYSQFKQYLAQGEVKDCDVEQDEILERSPPRARRRQKPTRPRPKRRPRRNEPRRRRRPKNGPPKNRPPKNSRRRRKRRPKNAPAHPAASRSKRHPRSRSPPLSEIGDHSAAGGKALQVSHDPRGRPAARRASWRPPTSNSRACVPGCSRHCSLRGSCRSSFSGRSGISSRVGWGWRGKP